MVHGYGTDDGSVEEGIAVSNLKAPIDERYVFMDDPAGIDAGTTDSVAAKYEELEAWWLGTAQDDLSRMLPKVTEYTASDLLLMGQFMEHWMNLPAGTGKEAACVWYALGKVARAVSAYREGRLPSEDTLQDLEIYAKMARRIREKGNWPW